MSQKSPGIIQSLLPIVALVGMIMFNVFYLGDYTLSGANQLALMVASAVAAVIAMYNGVTWNELMDGVVRTITSSLSAIIILLIIGMLSGSWMMGGVVPSMIYYGLDVLKPEYFLPATVVLCAVVSVSIGSSWSTIATIGVALLGIGDALGFAPAVVAGAIISGAYFGDKVSPLSDTTNLASAVAGTPLFTHIKYMMNTTVPSIAITIVIFVVMTVAGVHEGAGDAVRIQEGIASLYNVSPWFFLIPLVVVVMIVRKMPAIPVLFVGALLGALSAVCFQREMISGLSGGDLSAVGVYKTVSMGMFGATEVSSGDGVIDELLSTGGMAGMLDTVWLIVSAMIFGGMLESGHFLERLTYAITRRVRRPGGLVTATSGTCLLFNVATGDQYMSIVIPGKMFVRSYERADIAPQLLSRTLEDSATVTSVLIPWNTCGATQAAILGVATAAYAPFTFFCYLSPIITIIYGWLGIRIPKLSERRVAPEKLPDVPV